MNKPVLNGDSQWKNRGFLIDREKKKSTLQNLDFSAHYAICLFFPAPEQHPALIKLFLKPFKQISVNADCVFNNWQLI